jgi:hypothetical protein
MTRRLHLATVLFATIETAGGCNTLLGVDSHSLAPDAGGQGAAGTAGAGTAGGSGGNAGTAGSGESYGPACGADGSVVDGSADDAGGDNVDAGTAIPCGFPMPNPASSDPSVFPNQAHYQVNANDDSVTDMVTKLTWERNAGFSVLEQARAHEPCDAKGSGWRLPTRVELASLVDFSVTSPGPTMNNVFANDSVFANPSETRAFWTSSHAVCNTLVGWYVDFRTGGTRQQSSAIAAKIRCVKSGPAHCSSPRFQGTATEVYDADTGLTWQQEVASGLDWAGAKQHCSAGWRLPSLTELLSIVDETTQTPAIYRAFLNTPTGISPIPNPIFWTSSPLAGDSTRAWFDTFFHGHSDSQPIGTMSFVRCVR